MKSPTNFPCPRGWSKSDIILDFQRQLCSVGSFFVHIKLERSLWVVYARGSKTFCKVAYKIDEQDYGLLICVNNLHATDDVSSSPHRNKHRHRPPWPVMGRCTAARQLVHQRLAGEPAPGGRCAGRAAGHGALWMQPLCVWEAG